MQFNTEAYINYKQKSKWQNRLHAAALLFAWGVGALFSASTKSEFFNLLLAALFNGSMIVLLLEFSDRNRIIEDTNKQAGYLMEEIERLKSICSTHEKEHRSQDL